MRRVHWPLHLYRVAGESMSPAYSAGDTLLGLCWFTPRVGQVVVATHKGRPLIKRIVKIEGPAVWLEGDNSSRSTDSRHFGPLEVTQIRARVIFRLD
jgi:phage repressor protein C with HTH and peptisase S24 domain